MKLSGVRRSGTAICLIAVTAGMVATTGAQPPQAARPSDPIQIQGSETVVKPDLPDGGLPPVFGVHSFQVFRACRLRPELADGLGWTYNHHMDLACWKGRLYAAWESGEKDEDVWPAHELYSTSLDGAHWSAPAELFPRGVATPLRMYFFHSPNGRMLAIAGARLDHAKTTERRKGPLVVREIRSGRTLGPIYMLRPTAATSNLSSFPDLYTRANDKGFVRACDALLANRPFLEEQDYGNLLGSHAMIWHDPARWPAGKYSKDEIDYFGKSLNFYHRKDGRLVGVAKKGWVVVSPDGGRTWSEPVVPNSLITWTAKVWGQRTRDGRYALVYNPRREDYYPLVVVSGDDGIHFREMRVVYGEAPIMRYEGKAKEYGPRYVRGVSEWADDGSRRENALWVVYSVNEEDVWVSRIPTPIRASAMPADRDDLRRASPGPLAPRWNLYSPKWAPVSVEASPDGAGRCLRLEDRDPYDAASATRLFPSARQVRASFTVEASQSNRGMLAIELGGEDADERPVRLSLGHDGKVRAEERDRSIVLCSYRADRRLHFEILADADRQRFSVRLDGKPLWEGAAFSQAVSSLQRITFRTGAYRGRQNASHAPSGTDVPHSPTIYRVREATVVNLDLTR